MHVNLDYYITTSNKHKFICSVGQISKKFKNPLPPIPARKKVGANYSTAIYFSFFAFFIRCF